MNAFATVEHDRLTASAAKSQLRSAAVDKSSPRHSNLRVATAPLNPDGCRPYISPSFERTQRLREGAETPPMIAERPNFRGHAKANST